jgi:Ni,Fe-hydrogenase I cytochrome b subunit
MRCWRTVVCFATFLSNNSFCRGVKENITAFLQINHRKHAEIVYKVLTRYPSFGIIGLILRQNAKFSNFTIFTESFHPEVLP